MNPLFTPRARMRFLSTAGYGHEDVATMMLTQRPWATKQGKSEFRERVHQVFRRWLQERAGEAA